MASITSFGQTTNEMPILNEYEERISVIFDTLKNDYYWQTAPSDLMGHVPPSYNYAAEREKYPFRTARLNYQRELDSLWKKNLSEAFLISLLNKKHNQAVVIYRDIITDKLFAFQSDSAYVAICHFVAENPICYPIAVRLNLLENERYKENIRNYLLQAKVDIDFTKYVFLYYHVFDEETDKQLLDKMVQCVKCNLDTEPYLANSGAYAIIKYYGMGGESEAFENKQTRKYWREMNGRRNHEKAIEANKNYWREYAKSVLRYYEMKEKINE